MDINNSKDIYKKKKNEKMVQVSCKIPVRYKDMIDEQDISPAKLLMRACETLDESLKQ